MIQSVQHAAQIFSSLVLASTLGLSVAIGIAGAFHQRFPLDCGACSSSSTHASAKTLPHLVLASTR